MRIEIDSMNSNNGQLTVEAMSDNRFYVSIKFDEGIIKVGITEKMFLKLKRVIDTLEKEDIENESIH